MTPASARAHLLAPGDLVAGKYRVERFIGEGGMGYVVAATHERLGQRVALKVLLKLGAQESRRFEVEARASARLKSVHVARTIDVGMLDDGRPYMVMEYLEGRDLDAVIREPVHLRIDTAVDYLLQACEALMEAHALGIVHRDLKPSNLFLTAPAAANVAPPNASSGLGDKPCVKVLDFGISKIAGMSEELKITGTHEILGSPVYMSPEQLTSTRDVDGRTDVWSLGVILYELLTKRTPFEGKTLAGLAMAIGRDTETPVQQHRSDIPNELARIIHGCLVKDVARRIPSVAALRDMLAPFASPHMLSPSTPRSQHVIVTTSAGMASGPPSVMSATTAHRPASTASRALTPGKVAVGGALVLLLSLVVGGAVVVKHRRTNASAASAASAASTAAPSSPPALSLSVASSAAPPSQLEPPEAPPPPSVSVVSSPPAVTAAPGRRIQTVRPPSSASSASAVASSSATPTPPLYGRE